MQFGKSNISTEREPIQAPVERSIQEKVKSVLYETNIAGSAIINNITPELNIDSDEIQKEKDSGYKFSFDDPAVREVTASWSPEDWQDFPHVDTLYEFKKQINRKQQLIKDTEANKDVALPWKLVGSTLDVDMLAGGMLAKPFQLASTMYKASRLQSAAAASIIGATEATISSKMLQSQHGVDDDTQTGYSMLFGGAGGLVFGSIFHKAAPNVNTKGQTTTDRIAKEATKANKASIGNTGDVKLDAMGVITPVSKLMTSSNPKAVELATKLFSPIKALTNKAKDLVKTGLNGNYFKRQALHFERVRKSKADIVFKEAKRAGYKGTRKEFSAEVAAHYRKAASKAQLKAHSKLRGLEGDMLAEELSALAIKTSFKHKNQYIQKAAEIENKFYSKFAEAGGDAGVSGMKGLTSDGYLTRNYLIKKIKENREEFITDLAAAMQKHIANHGVKYSKLIKSAKAVYDKQLKNAELKAIVDHTEVKHMKVDNKRTLNYYDIDMAKWLDDDLDTMASKYAYNTAGKIGLQRALGFSTFGEYAKFNKKLLEDGMDAKDIKNLDILVETMLDNRGLQKDPASFFDTSVRVTAKAANVMFSPNFAIYGLAELATVIGTVGLKKTIMSVVPALKTVSNFIARKELKGKHKDLFKMGLIGKIVSARQIQRYDSESTLQTAKTGIMGYIERALDKISHTIHAAALGPITELGGVMAATTGMDWVITMAKKSSKLTSSESKAIARMGLDVQDLKHINKLVKNNTIKFDAFGNVADYSINKWDKGLKQRTTFAVDNHIATTILEAGAETLPGITSGGDAFSKITMQFTSFPIASYEKLLMKGINEADATHLISLTTSIGFFMSASMLRDYAKGEDVTIDTSEGFNKHFTRALSQCYLGAGISTVYDKGKGLLGGGLSAKGDYIASPTTTAMGPAGSVLNSMSRSVGRGFKGEDMNFDNPLKHAGLMNAAIRFVSDTIDNKSMSDARIQPENVKQIQTVDDSIEQQQPENIQPEEVIKMETPRTKLEDIIMKNENNKMSSKGGWSRAKGKWSPHTSPETKGGKTIAYGHKITPEEKKNHTIYGIDFSDGITDEEALIIFRKDVNRTAGSLGIEKLDTKLQTVATDVVFRLGTAATKRSSFLRAIKAGNIGEAYAQTGDLNYKVKGVKHFYDARNERVFRAAGLWSSIDAESKQRYKDIQNKAKG